MEVRAYLKGARLSPQKAGLVADQVRGLEVEQALDVLSFSKKKGADIIKKLLNKKFLGVISGHQRKIKITLEIEHMKI